MQIETTLQIQDPTYEGLRMTIPVREALARDGNKVEPDEPCGGYDTWRVTLTGTVPAGFVEVLIGHGAEQHHGLRLCNEPEYPGEWRDQGISWWEHGQWVACPRRGCGRALVWYEAGYVPGYRVCTAGHHAQLAEDGRSARTR